MKKLIFVYGTLKHTHGNHRCIDHPTTRFIGNVQTPPIYTLYGKNWGFPIVERHGNTAIKGELYEVNSPDVLKRVYGLEGYSGTPGPHNHFYDVDTFPTDYGEAEIFVMEQTGRGSKDAIMESGEWY